MATARDVTAQLITLTEEELRKIIQEEVRKAVEPGAVRPPYLPPVLPAATYPGIVPDTPFDNTNKIVINDVT